MAKDTYNVELQDTPEQFRFRLLRRDANGRYSASAWCGYKDVAHLGNKYAATQYYLPADKACRPVNAHAIANCIARSNKGARL